MDYYLLHLLPFPGHLGLDRNVSMERAPSSTASGALPLSQQPSLSLQPSGSSASEDMPGEAMHGRGHIMFDYGACHAGAAPAALSPRGCWRVRPRPAGPLWHRLGHLAWRALPALRVVCKRVKLPLAPNWATCSLCG